MENHSCDAFKPHVQKDWSEFVHLVSCVLKYFWMQALHFATVQWLNMSSVNRPLQARVMDRMA